MASAAGSSAKPLQETRGAPRAGSPCCGARTWPGDSSLPPFLHPNMCRAATLPLRGSASALSQGAAPTLASPSASTWPQGRPQVLASHPGAWTQAVHCPQRKGYLADQSQAPEVSPRSRGAWGIHQRPPQTACGPMAFPSVPESLVWPGSARVPGRLAAVCPLSMSICRRKGWGSISPTPGPDCSSHP